MSVLRTRNHQAYHELSIDVKLLMESSTISDPDRSTVTIPGQMPAIFSRWSLVIAGGTYESSISGMSVSPSIVNMMGKAPSGPLDFLNLSLMKFI